MASEFAIRQMTQEDLPQVQQIISQSFGRIFQFFANHSVQEEGQVLVSEKQGRILGFAKLIEFQVGDAKYGCILWIAIHPEFRRKGVASALTAEGTRRLKQDGGNAVFASTQRRNLGALSVLRLQGFRKMGFRELWRLFGWRIFEFYRDIWLAPGEIVLMHD